MTIVELQEQKIVNWVHNRIKDGELDAVAEAHTILEALGVPAADRPALAERIAVRASHHDIEGGQE